MNFWSYEPYPLGNREFNLLCQCDNEDETDLNFCFSALAWRERNIRALAFHHSIEPLPLHEMFQSACSSGDMAFARAVDSVDPRRRSESSDADHLRTIVRMCRYPSTSPRQDALEDIAVWLVESRSDIFEPNSDGSQTPFSLSRRNPALQRRLLKAHQMAQAKERFLEAVRLGRPAEVSLLLQRQTEVITAVDRKNNNALHLSIKYQNLDVVPVLLPFAQILRTPNDKGFTPLALAERSRQRALVDQLREFSIE